MPKVRTSVVSARAEVEPTPRDRVTPAPSEFQPIPLSARAPGTRSLASSSPNVLPSVAEVASNSNPNSNSRSTARARVPLGAREDSFPPLSSDLPRKRGHSSASLAARAEASTAKTAAKPPALSFPRAPAFAGDVMPAGRPQRSYRDVVAPAANFADSTRALVASCAPGQNPASFSDAVAPLVSYSSGVPEPIAVSARNSSPLRLAYVPVDSPIAPRRLLPDSTGPSNSSSGPSSVSLFAPPLRECGALPRASPLPPDCDFSAITERLFSPVPFSLDATANHGRPAVASEPPSNSQAAHAAEEIEYVTEDDDTPAAHQDAVHLFVGLNHPSSSLLPSGSGPAPTFSGAPLSVLPGARQPNDPQSSGAPPLRQLDPQPQEMAPPSSAPSLQQPLDQLAARPEPPQQLLPQAQVPKALQPATPSIQPQNQVAVPPASQPLSDLLAPAPTQHPLRVQAQPPSRPATPSTQRQQSVAPLEQQQSLDQPDPAPTLRMPQVQVLQAQHQLLLRPATPLMQQRNQPATPTNQQQHDRPSTLSTLRPPRELAHPQGHPATPLTQTFDPHPALAQRPVITPAQHAPQPQQSRPDTASAPRAITPFHPLWHQHHSIVVPDHPLAALPPRVVMTSEAAQLTMELHNGEMELLQPMSGERQAVLAQELVAAVHSIYGVAAIFPIELAHTVLETSRYLPGAGGWPTVENAMSCLRSKGPLPPSYQSHAGIAPRPPAGPPPTTGLSFVRRPDSRPPPRVRSVASAPAPSAPIPAPRALNELYTTPSPQQHSERPLSDPPAPQLPPRQLSLGPLLAESARFRLADRQRDRPPASPMQHQGLSGKAGGGEVRRVIDPAGTASALPPPGGRDNVDFDHEDSPDLSSLVDEAEAFETDAKNQVERLANSGAVNLNDSMVSVRDASVLELSTRSGLPSNEIDDTLTNLDGDIAATFISTFIAASPNQGRHFQSNCRRAGWLELSRRRRQRENAAESRAVATAPSPADAYASLARRIPLASQLGYHYRVDTSGVELPDFPDRAAHTERRRRQADDLPGFVVSDHDSDAGPPSRAPNPRETLGRPPRGAGPRHGRQVDDQIPVDDAEDIPSSDSSYQLPGSGNSEEGDEVSSRSDWSGSEGESGGDDPSDDDSSGGSSASSSSPPRRVHGDRAADAAVQNSPAPSAPHHAAQSETLSTQTLEKLLKRLVSRQSAGNNGLIATKPNFWTLGSPPNGGYHLETFTRLYREFREFKRVYGKHTGITFKNLITLDVSPLVREDLELSRSQWKVIDDRQLIKKLKARLGYQDCDHYIALLESCPKLPDKIKDTAALSNSFKDLSGKMLEIIERAHRHNVKLRRASLKHVFSTAIKSSYRMTNWFHREKFHSIGRSVRFLNTKIKDRLAHELERKHEVDQDARFNGVRGQIGGGTQESSDAPDRRFGSKKAADRRDKRPIGGIDKRSNLSRGKGVDAKGGPFSNLSSAEYRAKMSELYKIENALPRGRHHHEHTVFCDGNPCRLRRCQGCGEHQRKDQPAHDRPHCPHRKHSDFVSEGYFHEKWPSRLNIFARDKNGASERAAPSTQAHNSNQPRSSNGGRINHTESSAGHDNPAE
jgi:hypothetical protein